MKTIGFCKGKKLVMAIMFTMPLFLQAQDGEALFKANCTACHKIGGKLIGPDLAGVTQRRSADWLKKFIKSSQTLIKSGDKDAIAIFNEYNQITMPDQNLSEADIEAILKYIGSQSGGTAAVQTETPAQPEQKPEVAEPVQNVSLQDFDALASRGGRYFEGKISFKNGGPTCIACHNVKSINIIGGGSLAKDLSDAYGRLGEEGIKGILSGLPFPAMKNSFEKKPLTEEEIHALTAFLKKVNNEQEEVAAFNYANLFIWIGIPGLIILLLVYSLIWYNRKLKAVNDKIYRRQIKSF